MTNRDQNQTSAERQAAIDKRTAELDAMTDAQRKVFENRLRRMAQRQALTLVKSRRRDVQALDYGCYWLVDPQYRSIVLGGEWGCALEEVEDWLANVQERQTDTA